MAKIKHTKNELKKQREELKLFQRFLPMLILKKQQLQAEIQSISNEVVETKAREKEVMDNIQEWVKMTSEPFPVEDYVSLKAINSHEGNIAGVPIPIYQSVEVDKKVPDLFDSPTWIDDAMDLFEELMGLKAKREILEIQIERVTNELRVTSQRVNLFEKVKIPESKEHIRVINIFLGDEQTSSVARSKLAKDRSVKAKKLEEEQVA
jgi:V/A-type H+-transporting ATPase subunit D